MTFKAVLLHFVTAYQCCAIICISIQVLDLADRTYINGMIVTELIYLKLQTWKYYVVFDIKDGTPHIGFGLFNNYNAIRCNCRLDALKQSLIYLYSLYSSIIYFVIILTQEAA